MAAPERIPALAPELSALIANARAEIDRLVVSAGLRDDAIRHAFTALSLHLGALHKVLLDGTQTIAAQLAVAQKAQPQLADQHVTKLGNVLVEEFRPRVDTALYAMRVRTLAYLGAIGLGLFVGGAVVGGVGVWYAMDFVPTNYVRLVQPEQPAPPMATQPRGK